MSVHQECMVLSNNKTEILIPKGAAQDCAVRERCTGCCARGVAQKPPFPTTTRRAATGAYLKCTGVCLRRAGTCCALTDASCSPLQILERLPGDKKGTILLLLTLDKSSNIMMGKTKLDALVIQVNTAALSLTPCTCLFTCLAVVRTAAGCVPKCVYVRTISMSERTNPLRMCARPNESFTCVCMCVRVPISMCVHARMCVCVCTHAVQ